MLIYPDSPGHSLGLRLLHIWSPNSMYLRLEWMEYLDGVAWVSEDVRRLIAAIFKPACISSRHVYFSAPDSWGPTGFEVPSTAPLFMGLAPSP